MPPLTEGIVRIGSRVTVLSATGEDIFTVVDGQTNPSAGRVSSDSPVGRALIGHRVGDQVSVRAPGGVWHGTILGVQ